MLLKRYVEPFKGCWHIVGGHVEEERTHSEDKLAEMTLEIIERKLTGIFHLSGATRINR